MLWLHLPFLAFLVALFFYTIIKNTLRLSSVGLFTLASRLLTYRHAEGASLSSRKSRASTHYVYTSPTLKVQCITCHPPAPSPRLHTLSKADRASPSLPANCKLPGSRYSASLKIREVLQLSDSWPAFFQVSAPVLGLAWWHAHAAEAAPSCSYPSLTASAPLTRPISLAALLVVPADSLAKLVRSTSWPPISGFGPRRRATSRGPSRGPGQCLQLEAFLRRQPTKGLTIGLESPDPSPTLTSDITRPLHRLLHPATPVRSLVLWSPSVSCPHRWRFRFLLALDEDGVPSFPPVATSKHSPHRRRS